MFSVKKDIFHDTLDKSDLKVDIKTNKQVCDITVCSDKGLWPIYAYASFQPLR